MPDTVGKCFMPVVIGRRASQSFTIILETSAGSLANATPIDFTHWAAGVIFVASTIASVTLTWYGCATEGGTYVPLYDKNGVAVTTTLPGGTAMCIPFPDATYGVPFLKFLSNADDTESVTVTLKT